MKEEKYGGLRRGGCVLRGWAGESERNVCRKGGEGCVNRRGGGGGEAPCVGVIPRAWRCRPGAQGRGNPLLPRSPKSHGISAPRSCASRQLHCVELKWARRQRRGAGHLAGYAGIDSGATRGHTPRTPRPSSRMESARDFSNFMKWGSTYYQILIVFFKFGAILSIF